ncbi:MAG TPA: hypothetical protein VIV58_14585 [Kofleriaceae bacterium]
MRALLLCLLLPACLDEEAPDVPDQEAIFTIVSPASFDTLTIVEPDGRETLAIDPPSSVYIWDDKTWFLPDTMQVIASRAGAVVAYANETLTYDPHQLPNRFTIELHP